MPYQNFKTSMVLAAGFVLLSLLIASPATAFPLRIDQDCFYGDGEPSGDGVSTWMGYAMTFEPPYTPYTVDGISIFISEMMLAPGTSKNLKVSVLDDFGLRRQYTEINWRDLDDYRGWVLIDLADRTYTGPFTVIIHSGTRLSASVNIPRDAVFKLGIDATMEDSRSLTYTSDAPPSPPLSGYFVDDELLRQGESNNAKLVTVERGIPSFPGGNWMIRAHSPGLQTESTYISVTNADIQARLARLNIPDVEWELPMIDGYGPRGMVRCPTNLAGITFYYWQDDRSEKFVTPHSGPWIHPDLINSLGAMCADLAAEGVVGIEHIGIYNDRNIRGSNTKSSHAFGLGIDISAFEYSDGRTVHVQDNDDPESRAILAHIRDDILNKYFTTVLDWTYQLHDNHFHVNLPYPH